jgi:hypothetical protein
MEHPILFSTAMVKAILDGKKSMTRRIVKPQPPEGAWRIFDSLDCYEGEGWAFQYSVEIVPGLIHNPIFKLPHNGNCPYGKVGDILWVRETWLRLFGTYHYKADQRETDELCRKDFGIKWKPSIHMPRKACRIRLKITDIRIERLQDISEEDARAEGITSYWAEPHRDVAPFIGVSKELGEDLCPTRYEAFQQLWNHINKDRGHGWDQNDWVWVVSFERA